MTRRQKSRNTTDVTTRADIVGGPFARDLTGEADSTITNETESVDDEIATAKGEPSDADALVSAIQVQAYELYLSRGQMNGGDLADWREAEQIVRRLMP
jgi:hypothetical protein